MFTLFRVFMYAVISVGEFGALQKFFFPADPNITTKMYKTPEHAFSHSMEQ